MSHLQHNFLSVASHELKTPLTALLGQAQLLQRRIYQDPETSERDRRAIDTIVQQGQRINHLINSMLDISRLETGRLTLHRMPVNLNYVVRQAVEELQLTFVRHTVLLDLPEEVLIINGDSIRLVQALQSLLQNAVKYSPAGGSIGVQLQTEAHCAIVRISDQGIGIAANAIPGLFQCFYRTTDEEAAPISGLGVGLYVVREVITLHGGEIHVESIVGQGSTFIITLPLRELDAPNAP
ncbi:MAG: sensor histidine kinase [Candidatus Viridilinea halotolerans]|uniref:histidine kinase n=1 Tax=Candidatus Viridilinea halotolerans TaxID=2491704 RepID=A0A426TRQ3_9CHLR|nr:MAG: sensor histidine kinase [Candidatus Viridilinea halotolerans]